MFFEQLLLHILQKYDGQRTVFSAYHLLKGKKSGQTIQDVGLFQLQPYFNLFPRLTKEKFYTQIQHLEQKNKITISEDEHVHVLVAPHLTFDGLDGWHLRGGEHVFFNRFQLVVQTISNLRMQESRFLPIVRDERVQQFVRQYLTWLHFQEEKQQHAFIEAFHQLLEELPVTEQEKNIFMYRLSGFQQIGWTWQQLKEQTNSSELDLQLQYVHTLHHMIRFIEEHVIALFEPLLYQVRVQTVLTASTQQTANLLMQGMNMEQIAQIRRLKMSTIEDHIAEIAMNVQTFPIEQFVPNEIRLAIEAVVSEVGSKKLRPIKEKIPEASYFQIRLVLAWAGGV